MYYETREHRFKDVANALEAARYIKESSERSICDAVRFGDKVVVADAHCDSPFFEVAVLRQLGENDFQQIDSITAGWVKTTEELAKYFETANENMGKANLTIGSFAPTKMAYFTCGCCGNGFKSNAEYQKQFDQDAGYGICKPCERYYL
jgi:hypothetical protein